MSRYLWSFAAYLAGVSIALAEPTRGTLIGSVSKDILNYECMGIEGYPNRIQCDFVQVLLSKKAKPSEISAVLESINQQIQDGSIGDLQPEMCIASARVTAIATGIIDPSLDVAAQQKLEAAITDFSGWPKQAQEDMYRFLEIVNNFCNDPKPEYLIQLVTNSHEKDTRSCQAFVNKYSQTYVHVSDEVWAVESSPIGGCGVVNTSKFIGSAEYGSLWEHETSKIILNKGGQDVLACSELDESKTLYTWNNSNAFLGCDYIN